MHPFSPKAIFSLVSACALSLLAGCAGSFDPTLTAPETAVGTIRGNVHGGEQPISLAHIYVMQAATTGYGVASTSLITLAKSSGTDTVGNYVLTDLKGGFSVSGDYTCTSGAQVYLLAEQGNPGLPVIGGVTPNNTAIALMAALGTCPASGSLAAAVPTVTINEVSTVVTAYALAGFATDALHLSSSATARAATGLSNAAAAVPNMMSVASGTALTATAATGSTGVVPQTEIHTLANILASCVNASGPTGGNCPTLFADATANGIATGTKPTETATAAINIAHHPAEAPSGLYGLQSSTPPFLPALSAAPNDFTVKIYYTGGGLNKSTQLAVDGSGNVWVSSQGNNTLNEFSPVGVPLSGTTGFTGGGLNNPYGVAIDTFGNAWVANFGGANVSEFSPAGVTQAGTTGFTGYNDLQPYQIAIDTQGYVWVTNFSKRTVSRLFSNGTEAVNSNDAGEFTEPDGVAIDASNNVWVSDSKNQEVDVLDPSSGIDNREISINEACHFMALGAGASPSAWTANNDATISATNGTSVATSYSGGGLSKSTSDVMDGSGHIWVTNLNSSVSEFNSSGAAMTPSTGYAVVLTQTYGIAVDGSGNVWVTDDGVVSVTRLAELVGAATPTETPLVQAAIDNNIAGKP